ncbi:hypothetical protein GCM10010166_56000 [Couchioplanes caeruleus subsp. azureus]|nr:hypothetical protein GCM10010166_56000 [Couchioplanes caeruleus subsp. azureus]
MVDGGGALTGVAAWPRGGGVVDGWRRVDGCGGAGDGCRVVVMWTVTVLRLWRPGGEDLQ